MAQDRAVPQYDIFIAHAGADKATAEQLAAELQNAGFVVFVDRQMDAGTQWKAAIPAAQSSSRATVVLVPDEDHSVGYLADEIDAALGLHKANPKDHLVLPVYLGQTRGHYDGLKGFHSLALPEEGGLEKVAAKIAKALREKPSDPPSAPKPSHPLQRFPSIGRVGQIHPDLIDAYADLISPEEARHLVQKANALRCEIEPDAATIRTSLLPLAENSMLAYWNRAFAEAALHGPRMAAALLLVASPGKFGGMSEDVIARRATMLERLASSK